MKTFNKQLIEKFFGGTCTPDEAEQVLDWLETPEGQDYLDERLGKEIEEWDEEEGKPPDHSPKNNQSSLRDTLDSEVLFQRIIDRFGWYRKPRQRSFLKPLIQVAAVLCVISLASLFYFYSENKALKDEVDVPVVFFTNDDQQKQITLRDGSVVHMNSHSELKLAGDFNQENRSVTFIGEAYFDVAHQPDKPFIIHAGESEIEVLGTSFNVKLNSDQSEVGVAVTEGKVSLRHSEDLDKQWELLEKGQFASLNITTREIHSNNYGIDNYLSWKHGRLVYDGMRMEVVCQQLGRLYEISCLFSDSTIKDRMLTANFSNESLEKVLSVIGKSLNLNYKMNDRVIHWKKGTE